MLKMENAEQRKMFLNLIHQYEIYPKFITTRTRGKFRFEIQLNMQNHLHSFK